MAEKNQTDKWKSIAVIAAIICLVFGYVIHPNCISTEINENTCAEFIPEPVTCDVCDACDECEVCAEPVDANANVLNYIYDEGGNVAMLVDDLDDDELDQIPTRIDFIRDMKVLAANYVADELADEIDKEDFINAANETITFDEDDIDRIRVDDDLDEITIEDIDFEEGDIELLISARFRQDDVKYEVDFLIDIEDNEVDDIEIEEIREA